MNSFQSLRVLLFLVGGLLMLLDAVLYTVGALPRIFQAMHPENDYWAKRLRLNLMLANAGLYFTALFTLIGAWIATVAPDPARLILAFGVIVCLYSVISVRILTPSDWPHTLPRLAAAILMSVGLFLQ